MMNQRGTSAGHGLSLQGTAGTGTAQLFSKFSKLSFSHCITSDHSLAFGSIQTHIRSTAGPFAVFLFLLPARHLTQNPALLSDAAASFACEQGCWLVWSVSNTGWRQNTQPWPREGCSSQSLLASCYFTVSLDPISAAVTVQHLTAVKSSRETEHILSGLFLF